MVNESSNELRALANKYAKQIDGDSGVATALALIRIGDLLETFLTKFTEYAEVEMETSRIFQERRKESERRSRKVREIREAREARHQ